MKSSETYSASSVSGSNLYLDFCPAIRNPETMEMSRREYLGVYIYLHPRNELQREYNNEMLLKAEAIRSIRAQSLINEEYGFLDKNKMKGDFLAYFKEKCKTKGLQRSMTQQPLKNWLKKAGITKNITYQCGV